MSIAALIEAVEAGTADSGHFMTVFVWRDKLGLKANGAIVWDAYNGSLDAAKALHEALLPGIMWVRSPNGQFCLFDRNAEEVSYSFEKDSNTARAWLLAILRAKEEGK